MILKHAEGRRDDLAELRRLRTLATTTRARQRIDKEIDNVTDGETGERDVAYNLDAAFGGRRDYAVIHGLWMAHGDATIQIDHLVLTSGRTVFVIETKALTGRIEVDEGGRCIVHHPGGGRFPVKSPFDQARRHARLVRQWIKDTGSCMRSVIPVVAISINTEVDLGGYDPGMPAIRIDRLASWIEATAEGCTPTSQEELAGAAWMLAHTHTPRTMDWEYVTGVTRDHSPMEQMPLVEAEPAKAPARSLDAFADQVHRRDADTIATRYRKIEIAGYSIEAYDHTDGRISMIWRSEGGAQRFHDQCRLHGGVYNPQRDYWTLAGDRARDALLRLSQPPAEQTDLFEEAPGPTDAETLEEGRRREVVTTPFGPVTAIPMGEGHRILGHPDDTTLRAHVRANCTGRGKWDTVFEAWIVPEDDYAAIAQDLSLPAVRAA